MNILRLGRLQPAPRFRFDSAAHSEHGIARFEVAALLVVTTLLLAVVWPALASNRERSQRLYCFSNLRSVGQSLQQWGTEHEDRLPWRTSYCDGGTMPALTPTCSATPPSWIAAGLFHNPWFQFSWLSNELRTPKVLACPSDPRKHAANNWSNGPDGFFNPVYRNAGVSYFVGLDVLPENQNILVSGDRNVRFTYGSMSCSSLVRANASLILVVSTPQAINDQFHGPAGNFLFNDGNVEEVSSADFLKRLLAVEPQDNNVQHYLVPSN